MGAVHIGVRHDDHLVVSQLFQVELIALPCSQCGDEGAYLLVAQYLVGLSEHPFHVQDLALQGQDGLETAVPPHLCGASGGLASTT